jgi:hypothetical protein
MGVGEGMLVITAMRPTLGLGCILRKNYTKNMQRRGMMNVGKKIHISRI